MKQLCQKVYFGIEAKYWYVLFFVQKITRIYREGDKNIQLEILWKKIQQKIITYQKKKNKTKQNKIGRKSSMVGKKIFSFPDIANG